MHSTPWGDEAPTGLPVDVPPSEVPGGLGAVGMPAVPWTGSAGEGVPGMGPGLAPDAVGDALAHASNEELMQAAVRATREAAQAAAELRRSLELRKRTPPA